MKPLPTQEIAETLRSLMEEVGLAGHFQVVVGDQRIVGFVGQPGVDDVVVTLMIAPVPADMGTAQAGSLRPDGARPA